MTLLNVNDRLINHNDKKDILVVKYGSSSVSSSKGLDVGKISNYANKLVKLGQKYNIVVVSSGAVVAGKSIYKVNAADASIYSMVGSAYLVKVWQDAFGDYDVIAGQILVTHNDIADKTENSRLCSVIKNAISRNIIPIINENDVLSDVELAKLSYGGDNDGLASSIAITIRAKQLLLLTDVDGLFDKDGNIIQFIDSGDHESTFCHIQGKSNTGRGGMKSKIEAAVCATKSGVKVHIGNADSDYESLLDEKTCTHIH